MEGPLSEGTPRTLRRTPSPALPVSQTRRAASAQQRSRAGRPGASCCGRRENTTDCPASVALLNDHFSGLARGFLFFFFAPEESRLGAGPKPEARSSIGLAPGLRSVSRQAAELDSGVSLIQIATSAAFRREISGDTARLQNS